MPAHLGLARPVVQAPIGNLTNEVLAAAVSNAGGLGTLAVTWLSPDEARRRCRAVRQLTRRAFAVNVVLGFPVDDLLDACLAEGAPMVSTFWGDPAPVTDRVHRAGALHLHAVGSVAEARHAADAGVDVIVAQGTEAGGHVRGTTSTMALLPAVVDAVAPLPVFAAGGIADGRGLAAALALGASAGWLGTRFVASHESVAHAAYKQAVVAAGPGDTVLSDCFDGGWADAPHRTVVNSTLATWRHAGCPRAPSRPGEGEPIAADGTGIPIARYSSAAPLRGTRGDVEAMALYAGQSCGLIRDCRPAGRLVAEIAHEADVHRDGGRRRA